MSITDFSGIIKKIKEKERLEKLKLATRKKYAEIKAHPVLYALQKEKEKRRYQERKEKKQIKSIKDESPRVQREKRRKWREASDNPIEFIVTRGGQRTAVYQGHTFVQMTSTRWYCSKRRGDCKAILVMTEDRKFVELLKDHDHPAPKLFRTATGQIVRLLDRTRD
ncbi:hypothetical protein MSG28_008220 [Choristoneura fumiferana]|uniref:Uncharacterized protein n=1 Tax=Choristoneura fumiferana TaxID=7141 RepID=A0ACC0JAI7_CHOFU|nr:hypothetical protein MSG28_008220 [Choristoneura fumiferana]